MLMAKPQPYTGDGRSQSKRKIEASECSVKAADGRTMPRQTTTLFGALRRKLLGLPPRDL